MRIAYFGLIVVTSALVSTGSVPEQDRTEFAARLAVIQADHLRLEQLRDQLRSLEARLARQRTVLGRTTNRTEELASQVNELRGSIGEAHDALQSELAGFLMVALNKRPSDEMTRQAIDIYAEGQLLTAQDHVLRKGDYEAAIEILDTVIRYYEAVDVPPLGALVAERGHLEEMRLITRERFDSVQPGLSKPEVVGRTGVPHYRNKRQDPETGVCYWLFSRRDGGAAAVYFGDEGQVSATEWTAIEPDPPFPLSAGLDEPVCEITNSPNYWTCSQNPQLQSIDRLLEDSPVGAVFDTHQLELIGGIQYRWAHAVSQETDLSYVFVFARSRDSESSHVCFAVQYRSGLAVASTPVAHSSEHGALLEVPIRWIGSGHFTTSVVYLVDDAGQSLLIDTTSWAREVTSALPPCYELQSGGKLDLQTLTYEAAVHIAGDSGASPTGGSLHVQFELDGATLRASEVLHDPEDDRYHEPGSIHDTWRRPYVHDCISLSEEELSHDLIDRPPPHTETLP